MDLKPILCKENDDSFQSAPDIVVYNAGLPKDTCPPCNAGLEVAYTEEFGASGLAVMAAKVLTARPGAHFYWRSTTAVCDHRKVGALGFHNPAIETENRYIESFLCAVRADACLLGIYMPAIDRPLSDCRCRGFGS